MKSGNKRDELVELDGFTLSLSMPTARAREDGSS